MAKELVCDMRLESWVEPILTDMALLYAVGFIRKDTLEAIVDLLLRDGVQVGSMRVVDARNDLKGGPRWP